MAVEVSVHRQGKHSHNLNPTRARKTPVSLAQFFADSTCSRCRLRSRWIFPTSATKRG
jgi:hypothetical protein